MLGRGDPFLFPDVPLMGHTPQYGWDFPEEIPEEFWKNSRKRSHSVPGIFLESTAGIPQTLSFKAFEASRAFPEFSPPQYGWGRLLFQKWFRRGPLREFPAVLGAFLT